jgi:hypothetical protein
LVPIRATSGALAAATRAATAGASAGKAGDSVWLMAPIYPELVISGTSDAVVTGASLD